MHTHALQTFTEQVAAFHSAVNYNVDISASTSDEEAYKFASLYDRYFEYTDTRHPRSCQADRRVPEADFSGLHEVHAGFRDCQGEAIGYFWGDLGPESTYRPRSRSSK